MYLQPQMDSVTPTTWLQFSLPMRTFSRQAMPIVPIAIPGTRIRNPNVSRLRNCATNSGCDHKSQAISQKKRARQ